MQWVTNIKRKIKLISFAQLTFLVSISIFSILLLAVSVSRLLQKSRTISMTPDIQDAVILEQKGDVAIQVTGIDQARLSAKVQSLWEEALTKNSTKLATFPHDPELVAFKYYRQKDNEPSLVVYKNKPIILRLIPTETQSQGDTTKISLESDNYQLVVVFTYPKSLKRLDIEHILERSFADMIASD